MKEVLFEDIKEELSIRIEKHFGCEQFSLKERMGNPFGGKPISHAPTHELMHGIGFLKRVDRFGSDSYMDWQIKHWSSSVIYIVDKRNGYINTLSLRTLMPELFE
jgi:hypothetical protein